MPLHSYFLFFDQRSDASLVQPVKERLCFRTCDRVTRQEGDSPTLQDWPPYCGDSPTLYRTNHHTREIPLPYTIQDWPPRCGYSPKLQHSPPHRGDSPTLHRYGDSPTLHRIGHHTGEIPLHYRIHHHIGEIPLHYTGFNIASARFPHTTEDWPPHWGDSPTLQDSPPHWGDSPTLWNDHQHKSLFIYAYMYMHLNKLAVCKGTEQF